MEKIPFSDVVGIGGIVFAIVLLVLDKAGKLKGGWLFGLLCLAGAMTLFIAVGNSWVLDAQSKWKIWRGGLMVCLVGLIYSGLAIWISGPSVPSEGGEKTKAAPEEWSVEEGQLILQVCFSRSERMASAKINGALLRQFAMDYNLMLIMFLVDNSVDSVTDPRIEKSDAFMITDDIRTIQVNLTEDFIRRGHALDQRFHKVSVAYDFVMVPKHIRPQQISTRADVGLLGGKYLKSNPPPEFVVLPPGQPMPK